MYATVSIPSSGTSSGRRRTSSSSVRGLSPSLQQILNCNVHSANCTFNPIGNAAQHISQTPPYPSVLEFALHFPEPRADLLQRWRGFLRRLRSASDVGPSRRRAVAIIDSIVSGPGLLMPWREMVQVCREENVWSAVDAAHSLGQEPVDLGRVQPDFWVSVCTCAFLHA